MNFYFIYFLVNTIQKYEKKRYYHHIIYSCICSSYTLVIKKFTIYNIHIIKFTIKIQITTLFEALIKAYVI